MKHFYEDIPGWFSFLELYKKMVQRVTDKAHFVEVGCWLGRSTAFMAVEIYNSRKDIKFDCVDHWHGANEGWDGQVLFRSFLKNMLPVQNVINPIRLPSELAAKLYPNDSLDFVFIDGNHSYESVKLDIESWYPKVKSGGILAGHDYDTIWPGVTKAVKEFLLKTNYPLVVQSEFCWGIEKK